LGKKDAQRCRALDAALFLAGGRFAGLPIAFAVVPHATASPGVEAWTEYGEDGHGTRIWLYTESEVFRCASRMPNADYRCLMKLASIVVHEAWHFRHGRSEVGAYTAQITFLEFEGGSSIDVSGVRKSRDVIVAAERQAREAVKRGAGGPHEFGEQ
jgi:hypothetical protein